MRIGIDARFYSESGIGRYIRNLLNNLQELDSKHKYFIFLLDKDYDKLILHTNNFYKVRADFPWYGVAEQIKFPVLLKKYNLDLVHFPHFNVPIFYSGKFVVTIHDLIHQHHKMRRATTLNPLIYQIKHQAYNYALKTALKKSVKVITVSDFVKNQLVGELSTFEEKIAVTYEAVDDKILTIAKKITQIQSLEALEKFNIKPPFTAKQEASGLIFYVGNAHPHKNVEGLIKAFLNLRKKYQHLQLVLSGSDHYFWQRIRKEYQQKDIIYTGFVSDQELVALYKSAAMFVMPSLEEGFGIPLLEAMACGTAVVSSNAGSLPEVGGDAALYFDPKDPQDMAEKIMEVLNNEKLRKTLIEKGLKRYQQFSWKKLAEQTLKVYDQVSDAVHLEGVRS